ncbi:MAG: TIGR02466 family protein [Kiloniellales bacterium]
MFEKVEEHSLFPTCIWVHDLEAERARRLNEKLFHDLDRLTAPRPKLPPGQTWQTEQFLHELEEFRELVEAIEAAALGVVEKMEIVHDGLQITACWANINPKGTPHPPHFHPNNYLSGVYYVAAAAGADSIVFHEPRPQLDMIAPHVRRYTKYTAPNQEVRVKPGRLVLFPAWLTHSVPVNRSEGLRISIAFNLMFKGYVEKMTRPRWTGIPVHRPAREQAGDD